MRLSAEVFRWKTAEEWALRHVEKGFGAALWPLSEKASALDEQEFVEAARRHNIVIAEVGIWRNLFDPDPAKARENIEYSIARMKQADRVGARCCVNCSGSHSVIWDGPHRDNLTQATFDRIVALTQEMIDQAGLTRSFYTLEPMPWMYPTDLATSQTLMDAVNREQYAIHVDMVNMMNSPEKIFRSGELTHEFFTHFGPKIKSVHVKDITISDKLTVEMPEVLCGEGVFDLRTLMKEAAGLVDSPFVLEHLPDEATYDRAQAYIESLSRELELPFERSI